MFYRISIASAFCAVAFSSAFAADLSPPIRTSLKDGPLLAPFSVWAGFYAGVHGGYGSSSGDIKSSTEGNYLYPDDPVFNTNFSTPYPDSDGAFLGGQIGYNIQRGNFVFGIEADITKSWIDGNSSATDVYFVNQGENFNSSNTPIAVNTSAKSDLDWFGTVRGRLGYAWGNTLLFVTGGLAYGNVVNEFSLNVPIAGISLNNKDEEVRTGYVVGGGVEHKLTQNWSIKAEYLYLDLGESSYSESRNGSFRLRNRQGDNLPLTYEAKFKSEIENTYHTARVGLNYKF